MSKPIAPVPDCPALLGLSRSALADLVSAWGFKPVHGQRLWRHLHAHGRDDFASIDGLPAGLVDRLAAETTVTWLPVARDTASRDGFTRKHALWLDDRRQIETVLMRHAGRATACVSTQAGCAMGCVFCATGQMGFARHLTTAEIVAQALHVARVLSATGELLRTHRAHVNLIPLNPTDGYDGMPTRHPAARAFQAVLAEYGIPSTVRQRRGLDIAAGCGQLASSP